MRIGAHESVAGGLHLAIDHADEDDAAAIQIFTKNANAWREPELSLDTIHAFRERRARSASPRVAMSHNSYLINLAAQDPDMLTRSRAAMIAEVLRCAALGVEYVVFHPGSCGVRVKGESDASFERRTDDALTRVGESLSHVHTQVGDVATRILLENAAGAGGTLGCTFDQLGQIIARTHVGAERLGVCIDTQHAFASGYDLRAAEGYEAMWSEFDRTVGLSRLCAFHLNDSKTELGSRFDRHENIGKGALGLEPFRLLVNDPRFAETPAVLETPHPEQVRPYKREIKLLRGLLGKTEPIARARPKPTPLVLSAPEPKRAAKKRGR